MDAIFQDLKDRFVTNYFVYANDSKAYADADHTTQLTTSQLKDAFLKGCMVVTAAGFATPVTYTETSNVGSVSYFASGSEVSIAAVADPE